MKWVSLFVLLIASTAFGEWKITERASWAITERIGPCGLVNCQCGCIDGLPCTCKKAPPINWAALKKHKAKPKPRPAPPRSVPIFRPVMMHAPMSAAPANC